MPRAIVVTKLDQPRADFAATLAACQDAFGAGVLPLYVPEDGRAHRPAATPTDPDHEAERAALIEGIIAESEDETLMDSYLGGTPLDPKMLIADLEKAVARGCLLPGTGRVGARASSAPRS